MIKLQSFPNWHRYAYLFLSAVIAVCALFQFHAVGPLPVGWENVPLFATIVSTFVGTFLPAFNDTSGPTQSPPQAG